MPGMHCTTHRNDESEHSSWVKTTMDLVESASPLLQVARTPQTPHIHPNLSVSFGAQLQGCNSAIYESRTRYWMECINTLRVLAGTSSWGSYIVSSSSENTRRQLSAQRHSEYPPLHLFPRISITSPVFNNLWSIDILTDPASCSWPHREKVRRPSLPRHRRSFLGSVRRKKPKGYRGGGEVQH